MAAEAEEQPQEAPQEEVEKAEEAPEEAAPEEQEEAPAEEEEEEKEEEKEEEAEEEEEEEVVDPKPDIEASCKPKCVKQLLSLQACEKRVEDDDEGGQKHCTGQYFDYWGCIDKCCGGFYHPLYMPYCALQTCGCKAKDCTQALPKVEVRILYIRAEEEHLNSRQF